MSINKRIVFTYSKSLFQNVINSSNRKKEENFEPSNITSSDENTFFPDIFVIGEELLLIRSIFISSKALKEFLKNPTYLEERKFEIILSIFPGLTSITKSFLKVLVERKHLLLLPEISEQYNKLLLKIKNSIKVKVIVANEVEDNFGLFLLPALKKITKSNEVILNFAYSPKLLGGLILEYNSVAIDASLLKEFSLLFSDI
jgi:F-type H+-transporting ATPase subunit delta